MRLSSEPTSARAAREFVSATLEEWECAHLDDTVTLLTSELVGNVVRHAQTELLVAARLEDERLTIEVVDDSPDMVVQRDPRLEDPNGRGLFMVNSMADRWGVRRQRTGKSVWFELDLRDAQEPTVDLTDRDADRASDRGNGRGNDHRSNGRVARSS